MKFTKKHIEIYKKHLQEKTITKNDVYTYWLPEIKQEIEKVENFNKLIFWNEQIFENIPLEIEQKLADNTSQLLSELYELEYEFKQYLFN